MKYRKKPGVIEANQWDGTAAGAAPIIDWILTGGGTARYHDDPHIAIDTFEGTMCAQPNDWIICGVQGEFYPCKPGHICRQAVVEAAAEALNLCYAEACEAIDLDENQTTLSFGNLIHVKRIIEAAGFPRSAYDQERSDG